MTVTVLLAAALSAGLAPQPESARPANGVNAAALRSCLRSKGVERSAVMGEMPLMYAGTPEEDVPECECGCGAGAVLVAQGIAKK
ncbi:hypothetical protein NicSoilB8_01660 [Arthrobacter sp. NicSoilB8]|nr:hypothetical protein NicSoilB8_01660 [Arthrobacter sp. NicSoilB8]